MCTPTHCLKHYHAHYAIPVPGATRIEREMQMFLRIRLDRGRVERVEVLLPNMGFSRWYELENRTLVTDEDPEQRQQAMNWALERLLPVISAAAAGAHSVDIIPEPIDSISATESAASETAVEADIEVAPEDTGETMVLPVGLHSIQLRNVRLVVFAAGEGDYGDGFDGFYVERVRD